MKTLETAELDFDEIYRRYKYQANLTAKLDSQTSAATQEWVNEVILWKVNRYAGVDEQALNAINAIPTESPVLDEELTRTALSLLLPINGIQLPIASAILRFRNPRIYQVIDQRVYRFIYGTAFKSPNSIAEQISYYLAYLRQLKEQCEVYRLDFSLSDRILYQADKEENKGINLGGY